MPDSQDKDNFFGESKAKHLEAYPRTVCNKNDNGFTDKINNKMERLSP